MEREDEIIKKFAQLSLEKLRSDTINQLEEMPEQELWEVLFSTRLQEKQIMDRIHEIDRMADKVESDADSLIEMEALLHRVFESKLMIDIDTLNIEFLDEDGTE